MLSRFFTRKEQLVLLALAGSIIAGAAALILTGGRTAAPAEPLLAVPGELTEPVVPEVPPSPVAALTPDARTPPSGDGSEPRVELEPVAMPEPSAGDSEVVVSVMGAVRRPGVYSFDAVDRVQDAIERAGGVTDDALLMDVNQAARLVDGTTLYIPRGSTGSGPAERRGLAEEWVRAAHNPPQYTVSRWQPPAPHADASATPPQAGGEPRTVVSGLVNVNTAGPAELETLPGIGPALAQRIIDFRASQPFRTVEDLTRVSGIGPKTLEKLRRLVTVR